MKKEHVLVAIVFFALPCFGQRYVIDSLNKLLAKEKVDTERAILLYRLSAGFQTFKPDSALIYAQSAYNYSTKIKFLRGQSWALNQMAVAYNRLGNHPLALENYIHSLKIEEQRGYADNIAIAHMDISLLYASENDTKKALHYALIADSIIQKNDFPELSLYSLLNIGDIYEKADMLTEAFSYTTRCLNNAKKMGNHLITGSALNNLGNIYLKMNKPQQAIASYFASFPYLNTMYDNNTLSEGNLGLSKAYQKIGKTDSAKYYAHLSYDISYDHNFLQQALNASTLISQLYKAEKNIDSAFAYQEIMIDLNNKIASREKIKQLQLISTEEQLRQNEIAAKLEEEKAELRQKLQLLAIGIMIPIFFLISRYISRRKVSKKVVEFSGVLSLLLLFEYITLLIHPLVAELTHHSPFLEIIIFICIAAIMTPTHHKIESRLIGALSRIHEKHQTKKLTRQEQIDNATDLTESTD
jgi:tetratricopeptide (TPR) repeat protein